MMQRPWDCAQPDEWLPQSLRLCWGSGDSSDGGGGGNTGGGDWGSAGSYDASGFDAGGIGAWGGSAYDASVFGTGMGGGGDWGSFGDTNYAGFNAPNPTFADVAGPNAGVTTGGGDWGSAGAFSAAGTGGGPGGAMFGAAQGAAEGAAGGFYGGGGGGGVFGDYGGGGGGYYGGGGQQGAGGSFGSFGSGTLGGSNAIAAAPTGPTGSTFADTHGGGSLAGPAGQASSGAPTTSEAQTDSAEGEAAPTDDAAPAVEATIAGGRETDFGAPAQTEAAPEDEAAPAQDSFASRFDAVAPAQQDSFASRFDAATPDAEPSAFGPQSLDQQPAGEQGKAGQQQDSFDSRFGFDTSAPSPAVDAYISGGRETNFDYGPGPQTAAPNFNQVFADLGIQPGWNPAEQLAGRAGLAEPTDWAANPYQPSTDVSVGRDFNEAFDPFGDTPTGMDLAADQRAEPAEPGLTFNEMWGTTPYSTLPNDPLSRSAQETLESDFNYFPNPGYVQGPPAPTLHDRIGEVVNPALDAILGPVGKGVDYLMSLPNPTTGIPSPATAWSNVAQNTMLGGPNIQSLGPDAIAAYEAGQQGRAGANPDTTDWASVFEGAAPTEAQPAVEAFIPGGRETNFEYNVAPTQAPIDVEVVRSDDPGVPADPRGPPTTLPPAVEQPQEQPQEAQPVPPQEAQPAPPQEAQPAPPQEARPAPPSLIEQAQPAPPTQVPPAQPPGLVTMLPPPALTPPFQPPAAPPSETRPAETPAEPPDEHDDAPEPEDTSQPPQDPNAPRPPENIPGQVIGSRGTYANDRADNPQTNRNYRDSGRTDYPQGRPGITFRTARQAGIEPLFRTEDINARDVDARLVENINRALRDMERRTGIPANSLVATSGWRPAHRGEAHEHGQDPRTSQESVYTRYNPNGRNIGPAAQPGRSNHGPGRALDFAASPARDWLRAHAREYGLETLGRNFDLPHIQLQRGQGGQRPSEQEQAQQRALDAQNRQAAIDRGLISPGGRGNQQAGVPTPRPRPTDAPQPEVAQPRPPADIPPPTALPPQAPQETRPPADIPAPAPFLSPPRAGRVDPVLQARTATQIAKDMAEKGPRPTSLAEGTAAAVALARSLAQAGIPANIANQIVTNVVREGTRQAGYDPDGMLASSSVKGVIATALQGYRAARPGEVQGPQGFQPDAPGKQGAAPFGQQYADLSQSIGPAPENYGRGTPALQHLSPIINPQAPPPLDWGKPQPAPPPLYTPDTPGMFSPFRGNEAALPGDTRFLAKGGHVARDEPVVVGEEGPETFVPDQPGTVWPHMPQPGKTGKSENIDRWPKLPAPNFPGRYGGVEREMLRQTREAQNPVPSLMDLVDSGQLRLTPSWRAMLNDPSLIALGQSRMGTVDAPAPEPTAEPPDPASPMAQALGYGSIKRRPVQIGRQSYSQ